MFGILEAAAVPNSDIYNTCEDLILNLNKLMERQGFKIVKTRSHRRKRGGDDVPGNEIVRCDLVCDRGGRSYKCLATKHKTKTKKTDCPWKAKAVHRKAVGGWVLTVICDQHNHEAGTPEPPTPAGLGDADDDAETQRGPPIESQLYEDFTPAAVQLAGISSNDFCLTGETFQQLKSEYRKMTQVDRLNTLGHLQLRLAAIYAVQSEGMQRQQRPSAPDWRPLQTEANRKAPASQKKRPKRQQKVQTGQDQHSQDVSSTAAELPQRLQHDLIPPDNTTQAPEAVMQEPHFQQADTAGRVRCMGLPHFPQFPGSSRWTRGDQTNPHS